MATSSSLASSHVPPSAVEDETRLEVSAIDASLSLPVAFFLGCSVAWLLLASVFALISSFQLQSPSFLGNCEFLTFGRIRPAELNSFVYGWGFNVSFAVIFWLVGRLSRSVLTNGALLVSAAFFWNAGVLLGVGGILVGDSTSLTYLEIPGYATPLLFIAYLLIGAWAINSFRTGKSHYSYVSQLYLFGALFWFPWFYSVAQIMGIFAPARGTVLSIVEAWYGANLIGLWFIPVALAAVYYFIPKVLGVAINNYYLAAFGFWALAIFAGWTGGTAFIGGPIPAWVQSASIGASWALIIAFFIVAINVLPPLFSRFSSVSSSPTLRFIAFAALSYVVFGVIWLFTSNRDASEVLQFSFFGDARRLHILYAFFSMAMFGAVYYLLPRVLVKAWPSAALVNLHFWTATAGIVLSLLALYIGGAQQGALLNDSETPVLEIIRTIKPYLLADTFARILLFVGHIGFAVNVFWILGKPRAASETPTALFTNPAEWEATSR